MTTAAKHARVFGSGIRRREDPRLLTGSARYTADFALPGMAYAAILRSPHGHARIRNIDTSRAKAAPAWWPCSRALTSRGRFSRFPVPGSCRTPA
jgi:aerobic carbon-monoxide dehydrogenase large subunit